jgi:hypothetical protein
MPRPGEYAEALRCLGMFVDGQYARQIRILNADIFLVVAWQAPSGALVHRRYLQEDLAELSRQAQDLRGSATAERRVREQLFGVALPSLLGERPELLRTLGQVLDERALSLDEITEREDGFWVRTRLGVTTQEDWYAAQELRRVSQARRERRRP